MQIYEPERRGSVIAIPEHVRDRSAMIEQRAIVVEVGPAAWLDEPFPRAKPGDKVMIGAYSGSMVKGPLDRKVYRMVNANDIFCGITAEAELQDVMAEVANG